MPDMEWGKAAALAGEIAQGWTQGLGPGGAIILFDRGDIRAEACGGLASLDLGTPFKADSAVRYASISKHFLCALLVRDGLIGLDETLGAHLKLTGPLADVTVGRALDMTSGIPDTMEMLWLLGVSPTASLDRDALFRFACSFDALNFTPGASISYSNTGYRLVQAALEAKGIDYGATLHARFFTPLGVGITLPEDETVPVSNLATGYWKGPLGWQRGRYGLHFSASGGLAGSAIDLVTWLQAMMSDRAPAEGLLAPLGHLRTLVDGRATGYSLGLARSPLTDTVAIGHGGSLPGYKNHFLLLPEHNAGVVVLSNREDTDAHGISLRVAAALVGAELPVQAPSTLPDGLFAAESGPFWIEHQAGSLTTLGAQETLYAGEDGWAVGRSVHLPIRLRAESGGIAGEIGHIAQRYRPVVTDLPASNAWAGEWVSAPQNARLRISVRDGVGTLVMGAGPARETLQLEVLRPDLALVQRGGGGPWKQRIALWFTEGGLRLVTNRARVLHFTRG